MEFLDMLIKVVAIMATIILLTRILGLRSFSKMSAFDFAVTVAIGSVLASVLTTPDQNFWIGIGAIAALYAWKMAMAPLRTRFDWVRRLVDTTPLLVMRDGEVLWDNMKAAHMTHDDLLAKLRQANVHHMAEVRAVIVESTGVVSVMSGPDHAEIDDYLLQDIRTEGKRGRLAGAH
jgi:uncharacterized membrane protein YcaP (DUF421 family)